MYNKMAHIIPLIISERTQWRVEFFRIFLFFRATNCPLLICLLQLRHALLALSSTYGRAESPQNFPRKQERPFCDKLLITMHVFSMCPTCTPLLSSQKTRDRSATNCYLITMHVFFNLSDLYPTPLSSPSLLLSQPPVPHNNNSKQGALVSASPSGIRYPKRTYIWMYSIRKQQQQ